MLITSETLSIFNEPYIAWSFQAAWLEFLTSEVLELTQWDLSDMHTAVLANIVRIIVSLYAQVHRLCLMSHSEGKHGVQKYLE